MKTALLIPGWYESITQVAWELIVDKLQAKGYEILNGKPDWENGTHSDWLSEIKDKYPNESFDLVMGHSYGAMLGFKLAAEIKVETLVLCSLSPYFSEDVDSLREDWKRSIGEEVLLDVKENFVFDNLYKKVAENANKIINVVGSEEVKEIKLRFNDTNSKMETEELIVKGVGHSLNERVYVDAVLKWLDGLKK